MRVWGSVCPQITYNDTDTADPWDFPDASRFAFSTITTVGYGNIAPHTAMGQGLVVIYAVLGIGLVALALATVAEGWYAGVLALYNYGAWLFGARPAVTERHFAAQIEEMLQYLSTRDEMSVAEAYAVGDSMGLSATRWRRLVLRVDNGDGRLDSTELMVLMGRFGHRRLQWLLATRLAVNTALVGALALGFAGVFVATEGWGYGEGLWFAWVTATTIGFGDYIPGYEAGYYRKGRGAGYDAGAYLNTVYMLLNLGFLANCVTAAEPLVASSFFYVRGRVCRGVGALRRA